DVRLRHALHPVRMVGIRDLDHDGLDIREVRRDRNPVVEETGVLQTAIRPVDVLLVQRPADALHDAALHLALDVLRVDGAARILRANVTQDLHLPGFGVDLDVAELGRKAGALASGVDGRRGDDRAAGRRALGGDLLERHWRELAGALARGPRMAVFPDHV